MHYQQVRDRGVMDNIADYGSGYLGSNPCRTQNPLYTFFSEKFQILFVKRLVPAGNTNACTVFKKCQLPLRE